MDQLNRIVVATDLSAHARHAAERAAMIGRDTGAALDLLHVAALPPLERLREIMGVTAEDVKHRVVAAARQKLGELRNSLQERHGVSAATEVAVGALLPELARALDDRAADLLVCGARGESVIRHFVLGTTALRMLRTTTRPVLVVKQQPHEPYRRVLLPVDFSSTAPRAILQARMVAPQAHLVLLHVVSVPFEGQMRYASVDEDTIHHYRIAAREEAMQKLHDLRARAGLTLAQCSVVILYDDPTLRIVEQEQEKDCDLIAIGKRGEGNLEHLLLGSVTKHVLATSQGDVLVSV